MLDGAVVVGCWMLYAGGCMVDGGAVGCWMLEGGSGRWMVAGAVVWMLLDAGLWTVGGAAVGCWMVEGEWNMVLLLDAG